MVVYRRRRPTSPRASASATSSIPGFPASGAGVAGADPSIKVAFFALLYDQDAQHADRRLRARRGRQRGQGAFIDNVFEKPFKKSRIEIDDTFINRVVPEILEHSPELKMTAPAQAARDAGRRSCGSTASCGEINADQIAAFADQDLADEALGRAVRAARQLEGRGQLRRPPDLHLQGQGSRSAGPPRLRPRGDRARAGRSRPTPARCSTRAGSASTATA